MPPSRKPQRNSQQKGLAKLIGTPAQRAAYDEDPYYADCIMPLDYLRRRLQDGRTPLEVKDRIAVAISPYFHAQVERKPYIPTADELRLMEEFEEWKRRQVEAERRTVVEIVEYREIYEDDPS